LLKDNAGNRSKKRKTPIKTQEPSCKDFGVITQVPTLKNTPAQINEGERTKGKKGHRPPGKDGLSKKSNSLIFYRGDRGVSPHYPRTLTAGEKNKILRKKSQKTGQGQNGGWAKGHSHLGKNDGQLKKGKP